MARDQHDILAAPTEALDDVDTVTVIDADEFEEARRDERWREFCLNAEAYVAESTRSVVRASQPV